MDAQDNARVKQRDAKVRRALARLPGGAAHEGAIARTVGDAVIDAYDTRGEAEGTAEARALLATCERCIGRDTRARRRRARCALAIAQVPARSEIEEGVAALAESAGPCPERTETHAELALNAWERDDPGTERAWDAHVDAAERAALEHLAAPSAPAGERARSARAWGRALLITGTGLGRMVSATMHTEDRTRALEALAEGAKLTVDDRLWDRDTPASEWLDDAGAEEQSEQVRHAWRTLAIRSAGARGEEREAGARAARALERGCAQGRRIAREVAGEREVREWLEGVGAIPVSAWARRPAHCSGSSS